MYEALPAAATSALTNDEISGVFRQPNDPISCAAGLKDKADFMAETRLSWILASPNVATRGCIPSGWSTAPQARTCPRSWERAMLQIAFRMLIRVKWDMVMVSTLVSVDAFVKEAKLQDGQEPTGYGITSGFHP